MLLCTGSLLAQITEIDAAESANSESLARVPQSPGDLFVTAPARFRPFTEAAASEGISLLGELKLDVASLLRKPDFYVVVGGLLAAPFLIKEESAPLNKKWVGSENADRFFEFGETLGNSALPIGAAVALRFAGGESDRLGAFSSDLLRAQILSGALTGALKGITGRTRPDGSPYAFPSGHTSSAFAAAGVIGKHYGWKWGALAEAAAVYVGLSRLQENKHYVSDVIGGAVLGSYIAYRVTARANQEEKTSLVPVVGTRSYGLSVLVRF